MRGWMSIEQIADELRAEGLTIKPQQLRYAVGYGAIVAERRKSEPGYGRRVYLYRRRDLPVFRDYARRYCEWRDSVITDPDWLPVYDAVELLRGEGFAVRAGQVTASMRAGFLKRISRRYGRRPDQTNGAKSLWIRRDDLDTVRSWLRGDQRKQPQEPAQKSIVDDVTARNRLRELRRRWPDPEERMLRLARLWDPEGFSEERDGAPAIGKQTRRPLEVS